ncbi:MAG: hypothetical protein IPM60_13605 [Rhodospirillales bacterium]|nr:hypothetical protein [Rhodospirillales bacterium]
MTTTANTISAAPTAADDDGFLIARGGPFLAVHERAHLTRPDTLRPVPRALLYVAVAYLPLLALSLIAGTALEPDDGRAFLHDFRPYAAYLIALPVLVLMEPMADRRLRSLLDHFLRAEIIPTRQMPVYRRHIRLAVALRNSWIAEAMIAAIVYVSSYMLTDETLARYGRSWLGDPAIGDVSPAGWWAVLVSGPLVGFLLLRWFWRYLIWANLIRQIAGLDLQIATDHPDKTGGLAFISQYPAVFSAFVFAVTSIFAAMIAKDLVYAGTEITSLKYVVAVWIVAMVVIYTIPLTVFSGPLGEAKRTEMLRYAGLASRAAAGPSSESAEAETAADGELPLKSQVPADLKKRYDAANGMSTLPLGARTILPISMAAALPIAVAAATQLPVKQIIKFLKFLIL